MPIPEEHRQAITEWAQSEPIILTVRLFGSFLTGKNHADGDVDLAVGGDTQEIDVNGDVGHRVDLNLAGQHALRATAELEVEQLAREAAFLHGQHQPAAVCGQGLGPVRAPLAARGPRRSPCSPRAPAPAT